MKKMLIFVLFFVSLSAGAANVTVDLESRMASVAAQASTVKRDVDFVVKAYFATTASSLVSGLATEGTAATVGSKLTKGEFINGITMAQQLQGLFGNQAVTQGDYLATSMNLINGSDAASSALSQDVEVIGTKLVTMGNAMIEVRQFCGGILESYNASELSAALVAVSLNTVVFGGASTKQKFVDGMNLCQQLSNFMNNAAVTQGDWQSIMTKWTQ